jgi:hypothetical protein
MTEEVTDNIRQVLEIISTMNINRCSGTTYDLSVQECARHEIVQGLARHYGIEYRPKPKNIITFPVKGTRA